jgi:site-specific DNA recombinase
MTTARRKGVGYVRVSRVSGRDQKNGGESFISPDVQRERIEALAKANGIRIVEWYEDRDQSGKKEDRPGYQEALAAVGDGRASIVVVARMSRFARNVLNLEKALKRLERSGAQLLAGDLNVDTTTPQGKLMRTILAAIAQFELEVSTEQWAEAQSKATANGIKIANRPPLGYRWNADESGRRVDPKRPAHSLVPDPLLGPVVGEVFRHRAAGASAKELVELWYERTGERVPRQTLVGTVLKNRAYLGELHHGDLVVPDAHAALVSPEEWDAAQSAPRAPRGPRNGEGSLLAGILVCAGCGKPMTATRAHGRKPRYICQNLRADCPAQASVLQELADPVVVDAFLAWAKQTEVEGSGDGTQLEQAIAAAESAEAELVAYLEATSVLADPELFKSGAAAREAAVEAAQERVAEIRASGRVETLRTNVVEQWPNLTVGERRKLLAAGIERVEVHSASGRAVPFAERSTVFFRD